LIGKSTTEYIQSRLTMNDQKVVRVKETAIMSDDFTTSCGYNLNLKVPRTRDGEFAPNGV